MSSPNENNTIVQKLRRVASVSASLNDVMAGNRWSHVAKAADDCPGGEAMMKEALLPVMARINTAMVATREYLTAIGENKATFRELTEAFAAQWKNGI